MHQLCRGLRAAGVKVTLFASGDSDAGCADELVAVVPEALRLSRAPVEDPAAYNYRMLAAVAARAGEFDVIHNHHDYWMLPLIRMTRVPVLTTLHNSLARADVPAAFASFRDAPLVSISDSQRRLMPDLRWLRTIYHGFDLERFQFHREPGRYLAFLGRIDSHKRPDWAIEVARRAGIPLKIAAKVEGEAGRRYFEDFVKPHVDGRFIEFLGEVSESEKSEFLGNALGLVFPIDWPEPFGLVVMEALACGTPVLTRPCGSIPEVTRDGVTGFCSPDLGELARRAADLAAIDRAGCRRWVEKGFSLRRMTEDYIDVYRELSQQQQPVALPEPAHRRARDAGRRPGKAGLGHRGRRNLLHPVECPADGDSQVKHQG